MLALARSSNLTSATRQVSILDARWDQQEDQVRRRDRAREGGFEVEFQIPIFTCDFKLIFDLNLNHRDKLIVCLELQLLQWLRTHVPNIHE